MHTGDSIATGMIGITSPSQHYVARASAIVANSKRMVGRRGLHTSGRRYSAGRVRLLGGTARSDEPGSIFGSRSWFLPAGGDGVLEFSPGRDASTISIAHEGGGFRYRLRGGWVAVAPNDGMSARLELDVDREAASILISASVESAARIHGFESTDQTCPAITWYTSGIGGARITDLHTALAAREERGYRMYGALAPDLLTIGIGVNDTIHADVESVARSRRSMRSAIDRLLTHGVPQIALVGPNPVRQDFQPGPWFVRDAYEEVLRPVAQEFGLPLFDVVGAWGNYESAQSAGYIADQVHPTSSGHRHIGMGLARMFAPAATGDRDLDRTDL
jgi:lysophospholipase L1-like esterase